MKWLITIPRYLPENVGGNITYVNQFSEELIKLGNAVQIVTTTLKSDLPQKEIINGVTIHRVLVSRGNMGPLWFSHTKTVTNYINTLDKEEQFDHINPHAAFMVNLQKLRSSLNVVYTLHAVVTYEYCFKLKKLISSGLLKKNTIKELLLAPVTLPILFIREWLAVNHADHVIVMSHYVKGTIKSYLPCIDLKKVYVSRIGIDESFRPVEDKKALRTALKVKSDITLLTVRRLESRMGLGNLIVALSLLKQQKKLKGVRLYIAGKGSLKIAFEKLIEEHDLSEHISLLGFISDEDLRSWYQVADAFVMPTEELEGFGIVTIEAFASGLPVIATPAGANPEVAGLYCTELLAKTQSSPQDLADSILKYLENKESFNSVDYSKRAKKDFHWPTIISEINNVVTPV